MRIAIATVLALVSSAAFAAEQSFPTISQPDTTNPAVATFVAWHAALVNGDFAAYRRLTFTVPNTSDDLLRQMFDQFRSSAPKSVRVTMPKTSSNGSVGFESLGCVRDRPVVSVVSVGKQNGAWMVAGSAWGPSWNPKISEFVKCP